MIVHKVKVFPSKIHLPKKNQLAWKIAEIASDNAKLDNDAIEKIQEIQIEMDKKSKEFINNDSEIYLKKGA